MRRAKALATFLLVCLAQSTAQADPAPVAFPVTVTAPTLVAGKTYVFTFSLFDVPSGGAVLWSESKAYPLPSTKKIAHQLGSVDPGGNPISPLLFERQLWVQVSAGAKRLPRNKLGVVPYAVRSETAGNIDSAPAGFGDLLVADGAGGAFWQAAPGNAGGTVTLVDTGTGLTGGPISVTGTVSVAPLGITEGMIADGAVTDRKIAGQISASKINQSGLNADTLDGLDSTSFSAVSHTHGALYYTRAQLDALFAARQGQVTTLTPILPIAPGAAGPQVVNLQGALSVLLDRQVIRHYAPPARPTLEELQALAQGLNEERTQPLFGEATRMLILYFQLQQGLGDTLLGAVEGTTAARLNDILRSLRLLDVFVVRGTVLDSNGEPVANAYVSAFDRDLRKEQRLGAESTTDGQGRYEIRYTAAEFTGSDPTSNPYPDLVVRVIDANLQTLAESPVHFNAAREEFVDLTVPAPAISEWGRLNQAVLPLLFGQGQNSGTLSPWELSDNEIGFLAQKTALDGEQLRLWILGFKTAEKNPLLGDPGGVPSSLDAIAFYGWFRDGRPQTFERLIESSSTILMASFEKAVQLGYIPVFPEELLKSLRSALEGYPERAH